MYLFGDIGATRTRLFVTKHFAPPKNWVEFTTPRSYSDFLSQIKKTVTQLGLQTNLKGACVGLPGLLDLKSEKMTISQLNSWINKPIKNDLSKIFGITTIIKNDAELGAIGEASSGAGMGFRRIAYITLSTGVGGALVIKSQKGFESFPSEPGRHIISWARSESALSIAHTKAWQAQSSGNGIRSHFGFVPEELTDPASWRDIRESILVGLFNVACLWLPEIIIIGGGLTVNPKLGVTKLLSGWRELKPFLPLLPKLKKFRLNESVLSGAIYYLRKQK